jgi:hypothetical protein
MSEADHAKADRSFHGGTRFELHKGATHSSIPSLNLI